jgi:arylsulfatase A-like enzyme
VVAVYHIMLEALKRVARPVYNSRWVEPYHGVPTNLYHSKRADLDHDSAGYTVPTRREPPRHVLVIVVDALRPDASLDVGLDATTAVTPATWTFPAVTSLLRGEYPHEHGAVAHTHPDDEEFAMPEQVSATGTLPEVLEAAGYDTYAGCSFFMPFLALRGWFQRHRGFSDEPAETVVRHYWEWRAGRNRTFGYLHLGDLHAPMDPPAPYVRGREVDTSLPNLGRMTEYTDDFDETDPACRRYREHKLRLYRATLDYLEDVLGSLFDACGDDTLIVLTGDHGEAFWEHPGLDRQFTDSRPNYCLGHGGTPFDAVARVPLALGGVNASPGPGWPSLIDVPSTITRAVVGERGTAGEEADERVPGFGGVALQDGVPADRAAICEATRYGVERKAVYRGDAKLIRSQADDVTLTARVSQSGETFCELPEHLAESLTAELPDYWEVFDNRVDVGEAVEKRLKSLGYT